MKTRVSQTTQESRPSTAYVVNWP